MSNLPRRSALKGIGGLAMAAALLPKQALGQQADPESLSLAAQIGRNHGHSLGLTLDQVVLGIRNGGIENFSIQGRSEHDHVISLSTGSLMKLLFDGDIEVTSSVDAGHDHKLQITLEAVS